mgnify:CR=1 FL=1
MKSKSWLILLSGLVLIVACQQSNEQTTQNEIGLISAMEKFHTILRPLQHQAVPNQNIDVITAHADTLHALALQVQGASVPEKLAENSETIAQHKANLLQAVEQFQDVAASDVPEEILAAFSSVHDRYEEFATSVYRLEGR